MLRAGEGGVHGSATVGRGDAVSAGGALGAALWLGVVCTALADTIYFRLIATAGPTFFALINYLIPVVAAVAGVAVPRAGLPAAAIAALAPILSGVAPRPRPAAGREVGAQRADARHAGRQRQLLRGLAERLAQPGEVEHTHRHASSDSGR